MMSGARPKPNRDHERAGQPGHRVPIGPHDAPGESAERGTRDPRDLHDDHDGHAHGCCGGDGAGDLAGNADASARHDRDDRDDRDDRADASTTPESRIDALERELAEAKDLRLRTIADYQTAQRRSLENETRARAGGVALAARNVIPVVDHFDLALGQKSGMSVEKAVEGLEMLRTELAKALEKSGVERIEPKPGDEFDPHQHEAVMRQPAKGVDRDQISQIFQPGYRLGETVLRPAKVALAP